MASIHVKYLLLGAGAGVAMAAERLRSLEPTADTLVVTPEPVAPYDHAVLASRCGVAVLGPVTPALSPAWYGDHGVKLWTARRVAELDTARSCIVTDAAQRVYYDRLLLEIPATPPGLAPESDRVRAVASVYPLRDYIDLGRVVNAVHETVAAKQTHAARTVSVVGPTLMAMEVLTALAPLGLTLRWVTGLAEGGVPLADLLGTDVAREVVRTLADRGVELTAEGAGDGSMVVNAQVPVADLTLVRPTPIRAERYVLTDAGHQTSVAGVYAVGMGAAAFSARLGKHLKPLSAQGVGGQGRRAAERMAGVAEGDVEQGGCEEDGGGRAEGLRWTLADGRTLRLSGEPRFGVRWETETGETMVTRAFNEAGQLVARAALGL